MEFDIEYEGYKRLGMATIIMAVFDYKRYLRTGITHKADRLERFFKSDYFDAINMTNFTGNQIIKMCKEAISKNTETEENEYLCGILE